MSVKTKASPESIIRDIKRKTDRKFTAEEKIRIVLVGLRGEESITDLCRCKSQVVFPFSWKTGIPFF
jgi:hypothetical protein